MSYIERHVVTLTTDTGGAATGYTPVLTGKISTIRYVKTDFDDGVDFTITADETGETIWTDTNINASETVAPRQATHSTAGAAATYDDVGGNAVNDQICLANDRVKIVIASGGSLNTGTFHVMIE